LFQNRVIDAGFSSAKKKRKNKKKASENEQVDTQCHTRTSRLPIKKFLRKEQISGILFVAHVRRRGKMRPLSVYVNQEMGETRISCLLLVERENENRHRVF
jgi:hypothetical protein